MAGIPETGFRCTLYMDAAHSTLSPSPNAAPFGLPPSYFLFCLAPTPSSRNLLLCLDSQWSQPSLLTVLVAHTATELDIFRDRSTQRQGTAFHLEITLLHMKVPQPLSVLAISQDCFLPSDLGRERLWIEFLKGRRINSN